MGGNLRDLDPGRVLRADIKSSVHKGEKQVGLCQKFKICSSKDHMKRDEKTGYRLGEKYLQTHV